MAVNLHSIVRRSIHFLHPDQGATLYRSTGRCVDDARGDAVQLFEKVGDISMQIQSLGSDVVQRVEDVSMASTLRKIYVFAKDGVWSMNRSLGKTGDYLQAEDGRVWLVNAVLEDFSRSGWVCLQCQFQTTPVVLHIQVEEGLCRLKM